MASYGSVSFNGTTFNLTDQADFTGRQLDGRFTNYNEASEGEAYDVEFSASAKDDDGNDATVYWMFEFVKGDEPELDSLNWDNPSRVAVSK